MDTTKSDAASEVKIVQVSVRRMPVGQCSYCDQYGDDPMMPSHTPSSRCESGKRPHCTCDTCF